MNPRDLPGVVAELIIEMHEVRSELRGLRKDMRDEMQAMRGLREDMQAMPDRIGIAAIKS